jgi:hypothetical protein
MSASLSLSPYRCTTGSRGASSSINNGNVLDDPTAYQHKKDQIEDLLNQPMVDLWSLRDLALSDGGLLNGMNGIERQCF